MNKKDFKDRPKRLESINLVSFSHKDEEGRTDMESVGRTLDLSRGGILLELPNNLPSTNDEVEVTLGIRDRVVRARGRIVHQRELENGHFGLGISFEDISKEDSKVIAQIVDEE
ncbi:MAG: PilZ domain-containing protein [bacterium]|nr:MAG: PilZ domain-containing protein [bacterium]